MLDERGVSRRDMIKAAVAIGGSSGLAACAQWERDGDETTTPPQGTNANLAEQRYTQGPSDLSRLPEYQHAWGHYLVTDGNGNTVQPKHQVLLFLDYEGDAPPTDDQRERTEAAFRTLERAFQHGTGGDAGTKVNDGLLFYVAYSYSYFQRFDDPLDDAVDLRPPESVVAELDEDAATDNFDAVVVMMSDFGEIVLGAEEALRGRLDAVNGVSVEGSLDGIFSVAERRTGFQGRGRVADELDVEGVPEDAPLSMGFKSGFADNRPSAERIAVGDGPFAEGTTSMISRLSVNLSDWYGENDAQEQVELMFSPHHDLEETGRTGNGLGDHSGITREHVDSLAEDARERGCVGHTQKTAQARDDDFVPVINRLSEGVATGTPNPGFNFSSVQSGIGDFVATREAMDAHELDDEVPDEEHGIRHYLETERRATFLLPPRSIRALPTPTGE